MNTTDKEISYTVTEEEYREDLTKGLTDEETLKPGTYKVRRSRFINQTKTAKAKISLYLDNDILEYFRQRAEPPNAAPYQRQINNELRRIMESDAREIKSIENDILNNVEFLRALKERLETV
jgi:uncharacterized protein (DUF4415 family)